MARCRPTCRERRDRSDGIPRRPRLSRGIAGRHRPYREKRQEGAPVHRLLLGWDSPVPLLADYVAEDGATQMVNRCALFADARAASPPRLQCHKPEELAGAWDALKATAPTLRPAG